MLSGNHITKGTSHGMYIPNIPIEYPESMLSGNHITKGFISVINFVMVLCVLLLLIQHVTATIHQN